jgi:hypothetical protein
MKHSHAVVWIDQRVAKIFEFGHSNVGEGADHYSLAAKQVRHRTGSAGADHIHEDGTYLREVADVLTSVPEILIVGPSHAKWQLRAYLNLHVPSIAQRVRAVLHADHPSDRQIVSRARKYFLRIDGMTPQIKSGTRYKAA